MNDGYGWFAVTAEQVVQPLDGLWKAYKQVKSWADLVDYIPTKEHLAGLLVLHGFEIRQIHDVWVFRVKSPNPLITKNNKVVLRNAADV